MSAGGAPRSAASWHPAGRRLESLRYSRQECLRYVRAAFTRLELLAVLAALALLAIVALPALAGNRVLSDRLGCFNNLRQIGMAYHLWGNDHGGALPCRTPHCEGGLRIFSGVCPDLPPPNWAAFINNAWFHYAWISNELVTPSLLACPADSTTRPARDFSTSSQGGFLNPMFRDNAVSYFLGLDVWPGMDRTVIIGDRNLPVQHSGSSACSSGVVNQGRIVSHFTTNWQAGGHSEAGHFLMYDGEVLQLSNEGLQRAMGDYRSDCVLTPRP